MAKLAQGKVGGKGLPKGRGLPKGKGQGRGLPKGRGLGRGLRKPKGIPFNKRLVAPPSGALTYGQLGKDVKAAKNVEYADSRAAIDSLAQQSDVRQTATTNWFDQYKRDVAAQSNVQAQQGAQAQAEIAGRTQQSQVEDDARRAQVNQQGQADAASRGAIYTPDNTSAVNASNSRRQLQDAFGHMMSASNAARAAYGSDRQRAASGSQLATRLGEANTRAGIGQKRLDLAAKEGAFGNKYRAERIDKEWDRAISKGALGIKGAAQAQSANEARSKARLDRSKLKLDRSKFGSDREYKLAQLRQGDERNRISLINATKKGKSGGATDLQSRSNNNVWNSGLGLIRTQFQTEPDAEVVKTSLRRIANVPDDVANALLDWRDNKGTLSPQNWQAMKKLGVAVSRGARRKK